MIDKVFIVNYFKFTIVVMKRNLPRSKCFLADRRVLIIKVEVNICHTQAINCYGRCHSIVFQKVILQ